MTYSFEKQNFIQNETFEHEKKLDEKIFKMQEENLRQNGELYPVFKSL